MKHLVTATFKDRESAEDTLERLEAIGIGESQLSLILTDSTRGRSYNIEGGTKADEGAAAGATVGGLVGGVMAALLSAGTIAIPGLNLVVTGALISALAGLGAGAAVGGLAGALVGMGIPEVEAKIYENAIKDGSVLIAVQAKDNDQRKRIRNIFDQVDAHYIAA